LVTPPTGFSVAVEDEGSGIVKSLSTTLPFGRIILSFESLTSVVT